MFQKNIASIFLLVMFAMAFASCDKKMSPDDPLPDERDFTVFTTTNSNRLYGYNAETGNKTWEKSLNSKMSGSPVILGDSLYVITEDGTFYSWDLRNQDELVKKTIPNTNGLSIAASDTLIYVAGGTKLYCYFPDGGLKWDYDGNNGPATSGVSLRGAKMYLAFGNQVHCVDTSGNADWVASGFGDITTTVKPEGSALYFGDDDNKMYSIEASNGALIWSYTTAAQVKSSPLVYGGMSISGSDDNNIYCVDMLAGTGQQGLLRWSVPTQERVRSSPAIHIPTNTVLVGCHDYNLYAIDHVTGTLKWKYPTGSLITSSPTVVGDQAFFTSYDKFMYCINVRTGSLVWKTNMDYSADGSPVVDNITTEFYSGVSGVSPF
jgi:outer membrane protein assembly factor BamB